MYNIVQKKQILIYFQKHENSMHFYKLVDYNLHEAKNKEITTCMPIFTIVSTLNIKY